AGGTGGHLFPAEALAHALVARGYRIELATDERVEAYGQNFPAQKTHIVRSSTPSVKSPLVMAKAGWSLWQGYWQARALLGRVKPKAVVGFGGYPTVPPMLAAAHLGIPTVVHDANAVLGRANRFLAMRARVLATSFPNVASPGGKAVVVQTGNPVRAAVVAASRIAFAPPADGEPLRVVVFGGSQGARFFSDLLPEALAQLDPALRARLALVQQCRPEDMARVTKAYADLKVSAELAPFFRDLPARIAASHLVVSRSGASTVCELAVIGRPAIMVPLPHAIDQDQSANARVLASAGGGWVVPQAELSAERLASELASFIAEPDRLERAAAAAKSVGRPDADQRLADVVERVAAGLSPGDPR
ncbi:MAG: undecaprenyldiphospho-muramoylpentapeptide beta-N-acetylglucosaminyltransferase, partial [Rhizobiales bacterium]|nr:undecaprenyldiphospho-muramoylpentapeptide beta-N-acetylglucosaminyltransferase [Hyphomicrobiales bacterium]